MQINAKIDVCQMQKIQTLESFFFSAKIFISQGIFQNRVFPDFRKNWVQNYFAKNFPPDQDRANKKKRQKSQHFASPGVKF